MATTVGALGALAAAGLLSYAAPAAADDLSVPPAPPATAVLPPGIPHVPPPSGGPDDRRFQIDPIADLAVVGLAVGFGGISELILSTGEIRPQRPVNPNALLGIDSGAVSQQFDPGASARSNVGLYAALAFAVLDPALSGLRDGPDAALVDAVIYAESLSMTFALTNLAKIAVRRPRPSAYVAQAALDKQYPEGNGPSITDTDYSLSFFSGHAATCAATTATATYLAFSRSPDSWRPWVTLAVGTLVTTGVAYERVRAGAHFPTDVIAGTLAGAGMGTIIPHLHRRKSTTTSWIGLDPVPAGLGLAWQGFF